MCYTLAINLGFNSQPKLAPSRHVNVDSTLNYWSGLDIKSGWFCKNGPESPCDVEIKLKLC